MKIPTIGNIERQFYGKMSNYFRIRETKREKRKEKREKRKEIPTVVDDTSRRVLLPMASLLYNHARIWNIKRDMRKYAKI